MNLIHLFTSNNTKLCSVKVDVKQLCRAKKVYETRQYSKTIADVIWQHGHPKTYTQKYKPKDFTTMQKLLDWHEEMIRKLSHECRTDV